MSKTTTDIHRIQPSTMIDLPWEPLNAVDLAYLAEATVRTFALAPAGEPLPMSAQEALCRILRLTDLHRAGKLNLPAIARMVPAPEGAPADFPCDPVGIAAWPWRKALWPLGWDAYVSRRGSAKGHAMLIAAWPDDRDRLSALRRGTVRPVGESI